LLRALDVHQGDDRYEMVFNERYMCAQEFGDPESLHTRLRGCCGYSLDGRAFNLLLTCKKVHEELEPIIYAENTFGVCQGNPNGFERVWGMSDRAITSLASLTIRLTRPYGYNTSSISWMWQLDILEPIDSSRRSGRLILREWNALVKHFATLLVPGRLELFLKFCSDSKDVETTLAPLLDLPALRNVGVCPLNSTYSRNYFRVSVLCTTNGYTNRTNPPRTFKLHQMMRCASLCLQTRNRACLRIETSTI
jgi:hypothetical protein